MKRFRLKVPFEAVQWDGSSEAFRQIATLANSVVTEDGDGLWLWDCKLDDEVQMGDWVTKTDQRVLVWKDADFRSLYEGVQ